MKSFLIDISKLVTFKTWARNYGMEKSGRPYTPSYGYKLFADATTSPASREVKEKYVLIEIDGITFVTEKKHLPKK